MPTLHRIFLIFLSILLVLTGVGIFATRNRVNPGGSPAAEKKGQAVSPVNLEQFQNAQSLAPFAATSDEQDLARNALRQADHEVDFAYAAALSEVASQTLPSTAEIKTIQQRISVAQQRIAGLQAEVARLTNQQTAAKDSQKSAVGDQIDLANARLELNQDELADANGDLERAGGDPQSRIQRLVDAHKAESQNSSGQPSFGAVGSQAGSTIPASMSFLANARAWYALHSVARRLDQAEQESAAEAAGFSKQHDALEDQVEERQSKQAKKIDDAHSAGNASPAPADTAEAISTYKSLTAMQRRMSSLDTRIRNEEDLSGTYKKWGTLVSTRERGLMHGLLLAIAVMLAIGLAVLLTTYFLERMFARVEPDQQRLLTLRSVAHILTRAVGAILILLIIFGIPTQIATVLALAGAGLTVAMKDFIVGFFGWFILMGKNGIRHGDWVEINGVSGEVVEIGLFHTVLLETGNWNDAGHPTGRRVTFVNSYAIEGHYFNFSTSGQWLWDELQLVVPLDQDPYPIVEEIQKIVAKETEANAKLAEQEWGSLGNERGIRPFSAGPAISVRPANPGFEITVRYVTRANERHQQRGKLYHDIVELLRRKNIPEPAATGPA
jgi:small-conductance mechanosensitive channel